MTRGLLPDDDRADDVQTVYGDPDEPRSGRSHSPARYFVTVAERLAQPPVSSPEVMPSPSMYDELLQPMWWHLSGLSLTAPASRRIGNRQSVHSEPLRSGEDTP